MLRRISSTAVCRLPLSARYLSASRKLNRVPLHAFSNRKNPFDLEKIKETIRNAFKGKVQDDEHKLTKEQKIQLGLAAACVLFLGGALLLYFGWRMSDTLFFSGLNWLTYTEFKEMVDRGEISKIDIYSLLANKETADRFVYVVHSKKGLFKLVVKNPDDFVKNLEAYQASRKISLGSYIEISYKYKTLDPNFGFKLLMAPLILVLVGGLFRGVRDIGKSINGLMGGGIEVMKPSKFKTDTLLTSFKDIAGLENAKLEIREFVDFLRNPAKFNKLGARMPKGALLTGPPGTGKTLLAKACAKEAGVSFFSVSGSEFVEKYVGVGAANVRNLFSEAKMNAPSVIFIDEIDAVGKKRQLHIGHNAEREHTLNQLLVEMDGFDTKSNVVVLAATNRADVLDAALKRPGRFDRHICLTLPDLSARTEIFKIYLSRIGLEDTSNEAVERLAKRLSTLTPGFSGADISNLCNEAAIVAARDNKLFVASADFEEATERVIGGLKRKTLIHEKEKQLVAVHESGHAVASWFLKGADPLLKVTVIARSKGALGFAQYLVDDSDYNTKSEILDRIVFTLGGRIAEEIFFNKVSTGAQDDLQKAFSMAHGLAARYGMDDDFKYINVEEDDDNSFMPSFKDNKLISDHTQNLIDQQVQKIINECAERCRHLLTDKKELIDQLSKRLLEKESVTLVDLIEILGPRPFKPNSQFQAYLEENIEKVPA